MTWSTEEFFEKRVAGSIARLRELAAGIESGDLPEHLGPMLLQIVDDISAGVEEWADLTEELEHNLDRTLGLSIFNSVERFRYQALFDLVQDGVVVTDEKGMIREANNASAEILGAGPRMVVNKPFALFLERHSCRLLFSYIQKLNSGQLDSIRDWEAKMQSADGKQFDALLSATALKDRNCATGYICWQFKDISDRIKSRELLVQQTRELQHVNLELEQFAYVAAHDLQQPARIMATYATLLSKRVGSGLDPGARAELSFIVSSATRMVALIKDLLSYCRVDKTSVELAPVDSMEVAREVISSLDAEIKESGTSVTLGRLPYVMTRRSQLVQVLSNLIANAIKFHGADPPEVSIDAKWEGGIDSSWTFEIKDNGIGIDRQHHEKIFNMFQRAGNAGNDDGTGIGLAICRRILETHGEKIWVESEPGRGSTFYFTLRAAPVPRPNVRRPRKAVVRREPGSAGQRDGGGMVG